MKTSRKIIYYSFVYMIIILLATSILLFFKPFGCNSYEVIKIIMPNLICGFLVTFLTAYCEFQSARDEIINKMYDLYYDLYLTYHYTVIEKKNNHYDVEKLFKKMTKMSYNFNSIISRYHGLFKEKDCTYYLLNPNFNEINAFSFSDVNECINKKNNSKIFENKIAPFFINIESILRAIDEKRFLNDLEVSKEVHLFLYDEN